MCIRDSVGIPDGSKDIPVDRYAPRLRLKQSLDEVFAEKLDPAANLDAVESKLFGIGSESYVAVSYTHLARRRQLRVGASITVGACSLTEIVRRFEEKNPDSEVTVFVDNTSVVEAKVLDSSLDLGLVEGHVSSDRLVVRPRCV